MISKQTIRLMDVFLIGPFLIYAGSKKSDLSREIKLSLIVVGVSTIIYNASNYISEKK